jgi:hypothetical protein
LLQSHSTVTSCTPLHTVTREPALHKLQTLHEPNLISTSCPVPT